MEKFEKIYNGFMTFMDSSETYAKPDVSLISKYTGKLRGPIDEDDWITRIWETHGFCSYKNGLITFVNPEEFNEIARKFPDVSPHAEVFAKSAMGCLFLWEHYSFGRNIVHLNVHKRKKEIIATNFDVFLEWDLSSSNFWKENCYGRWEFAALEKFETIPYHQCAGYVPALALGGSESVRNMQLLDVKEHLELLAQLY